jgi:hypothetical protein
MLRLEGPNPQWPQAPQGTGTFDWTNARFFTRVPDDVRAITLLLGLEQTTGKVWFDDIRITRLAARPAVTRTASAMALDRRIVCPRLRGAMIGPRVDADDLRELGRDWGANHIRWQILWDSFVRSPADTADPEAYDAWLETELQRLERLLPVCQEVGIHVLLDLHTPPGGRIPESRICRIFQEARFQQQFLDVWDRIVKRVGNHPAVWGYDLVNEPLEGSIPEGLLNWQSLALEAAKRIRRLGPRKAIIVEPAPWGSPDSLDHFEPLPGIEGVVYSVHMYAPSQFTHQGIYDNPEGVTYPGTIQGRHWDSNQIREALQPAIRFQQDFQVPIYIGEFSAIRWAPGTSAHDYLRDLIDVMEEQGWDWAYHAFREWDGWSVEHGPDRANRQPSPTPTDRQRLLRSYFARNVKTAGQSPGK